MKPISLLLVAALSCASLTPALAATRPRYGGTLRMEARGTLTSLDTASGDSYADRVALRDRMLGAVCDGLVTLDSGGNPHPALATSWRTEREGRSWYFVLRSAVPLHNGSMLTPQVIVTALSGANPNWHIRMTEADREMLIQSDVPLPNMLPQLAESRNAVCIRGDGGQWIGSGPFFMADFQPGKAVQLRAFNDCWRGRPYLDRIDIAMGKSLSEQTNDLELGRADLVEADPTQPKSQATASGSAPDELLALVFSASRPSAQDAKLRESIAKSIDRTAIYQVLLRRQGEPNASLLPEWISGYAHLFSTGQDLPAARQLRAEMTSSAAPLSLAYDSADPIAKLVAERIAVNAREAGIVLQPYGELLAARPPNADVKLVRARINSPDAAVALARIGETLGIASLQKIAKDQSIDGLYHAESDALKDYTIIPIAHVPEAFSIIPGLHDWAVTPWGSLRLEDLWLEAAP